MNEDLLSKKWIEIGKVGTQIQVLIKKAGSLMISDKKEQFSYRNWCNFIVKNIQKMRHFRRNLVSTLRFKQLPFRQIYLSNSSFWPCLKL